MKINHDITKKGSLLSKCKMFLSHRNILAYAKNRIGWHLHPRLKITKKYPLHIDIELSSRCQLKCPMCFRHHRKIDKLGNMTFEMFKRIVDEISDKVYSIKFTGRGEPLLNGEFNRFMQYLKPMKFGEISMITNGQFVTDEVIEAMIDGGMDRIAFSIDGLKKEYERIRAPMKYEQIESVLKRIREVKKSKHSKKPLVRIQSVKTTIKAEDDFVDFWSPLSDEILFLEYKDYSKEAQNKDQAVYSCPLLYQRMMIHWDGTVPMCINDEYEDSVVGNVSERSVDEIWKGRLIVKARSVHDEGLRSDMYTNCKVCALHREGHGKK